MINLHNADTENVETEILDAENDGDGEIERNRSHEQSFWAQRFYSEIFIQSEYLVQKCDVILPIELICNVIIYMHPL